MSGQASSPNPKRAVVLLSGGLDSATVLGVAARRGFEVYALSFDYGQRHRLELGAAERQAKHFHAARHVTIKLGLSEFGGSALTANIAVPKAAAGSPVADGIPVTYVPARNTVFLSVALAWAEVLRAEAIFIGVNAVDYSGYPDCRPEFVAAFEKMARLATKAGVEGTWPLRVEAPLMRLSKAEIVRLAVEVGVDFSATWSCYDPQFVGNGESELGMMHGNAGVTGSAIARPCGQCDSCRLRAQGFAEAGVVDTALKNGRGT